MFTIEKIVEWLVSGLFQNFVWVLIGILFAYFIRDRWEKWRFGRWRVIVIINGKEEVNRAISPAKAHEILVESADLAVFLKGVASPYGWINCDLIEEGRKIGLLVTDYRKRVHTIDLDKNPPGQDRKG